MSTKKLIVDTGNKDAYVSFKYTWANQQDMSIHEERIVLRIIEACQPEIKSQKLKDVIKSKTKFQHGLWDVDVEMSASDVIFSNREYKEVIKALDNLSERFFTYEDENVWWKCGFISNPKYVKKTGVITFRVANELWDVFTNFSAGFRKFELSKALELPTSYAIHFYMMISGQVEPFSVTVEKLKSVLGIPADKYKGKDGKDRIDNLENRVLKPVKEVLDKKCPYGFEYSKIHANPNNRRSAVTGFTIHPYLIKENRDPNLEFVVKGTKNHLDPDVECYLKYPYNFTEKEIYANKETLLKAQELLPNLFDAIRKIYPKANRAENPKGYLINTLKGKIEDAEKNKGTENVNDYIKQIAQNKLSEARTGTTSSIGSITSMFAGQQAQQDRKKIHEVSPQEMEQQYLDIRNNSPKDWVRDVPSVNVFARRYGFTWNESKGVWYR